MNSWQLIIVSIYGLGGLIGFLISFWMCLKHKKSFTLTPIFNIYGAFVYADMVIFGIFWTITSMLAILLNDWILFLLIISVFWLVRSVGESIYWFNQQFSTINRNPPENFKLKYKIFHNDSVWFIHQITWQCITVITIITSIYLATFWVSNIINSGI